MVRRSNTQGFTLGLRDLAPLGLIQFDYLCAFPNSFGRPLWAAARFHKPSPLAGRNTDPASGLSAFPLSRFGNHDSYLLYDG